MKRILFAILVFTCMSLAATAVSASYICNLQYEAGNSSYGNYGNIQFDIGQTTECSAFPFPLISGRFCSTGATNSSCATSSIYRFTSADQTATFFAVMLEALERDTPLTLVTASCIGGGGGCAARLQFHFE